mgnify:CR=1 FL=1
MKAFWNKLRADKPEEPKGLVPEFRPGGGGGLNPPIPPRQFSPATLAESKISPAIWNMRLSDALDELFTKRPITTRTELDQFLREYTNRNLAARPDISRVQQENLNVRQATEMGYDKMAVPNDMTAPAPVQNFVRFLNNQTLQKGKDANWTPEQVVTTLNDYLVKNYPEMSREDRRRMVEVAYPQAIDKAFGGKVDAGGLLVAVAQALSSLGKSSLGSGVVQNDEQWDALYNPGGTPSTPKSKIAPVATPTLAPVPAAIPAPVPTPAKTPGMRSPVPEPEPLSRLGQLNEEFAPSSTDALDELLNPRPLGNAGVNLDEPALTPEQSAEQARQDQLLQQENYRTEQARLAEMERTAQEKVAEQARTDQLLLEEQARTEQARQEELQRTAQEKAAEQARSNQSLLEEQARKDQSLQEENARKEILLQEENQRKEVARQEELARTEQEKAAEQARTAQLRQEEIARIEQARQEERARSEQEKVAEQLRSEQLRQEETARSEQMRRDELARAGEQEAAQQQENQRQADMRRLEEASRSRVEDLPPAPVPNALDELLAPEPTANFAVTEPLGNAGVNIGAPFPVPVPVPTPPAAQVVPEATPTPTALPPTPEPQPAPTPEPAFVPQANVRPDIREEQQPELSPEVIEQILEIINNAPATEQARNQEPVWTPPPEPIYNAPEPVATPSRLEQLNEQYYPSPEPVWIPSPEPVYVAPEPVYQAPEPINRWEQQEAWSPAPLDPSNQPQVNDNAGDLWDYSPPSDSGGGGNENEFDYGNQDMPF